LFFLLLSATTFAVAQEDLSVTLIDFNTQNQFRIWILLINSSRNSSLQQISNNQGKVTFRGIPALDGYQVVLMEPLYLPVKIRFISVRSNQASNVTLVLAPKKTN
jgi:hypothetical protein